MKFPLLLIASLFLVCVARAETSYVGLKGMMTEAEWKRAGLDRLSVDELGVIDAALIRHQRLTTSTLIVEAQRAREAAEVATLAGTDPAAAQKRGWMQRFGLPIIGDADWRSLPALKAKVVSWEGGNRFKLDNDQVWEGSEPLTYELVGREIEIQARPAGKFALIVEGKNTTLRVVRVR